MEHIKYQEKYEYFSIIY